MSKIKLSIVSLILLIYIQVAAQKVPGYLGKKVIVGISYDYSPGIGELIIGSSETNENELLGVTPMAILLPSPRVSLLSRFVIEDQSTFNINITTQGRTYARNVEYMNIGNSVLNYKIEYAKTNTNTLTLSFSKHLLNIAPVGSFVSGGLLISQTTTTYKEENKREETKSSFDFGYHGAFGTRRIFKDRIVTEFSLEYNLYFSGLFSSGKYKGFSNGEDHADVHHNRAYSVNAWNNLLLIHMGLGYIF